MVNVKLSNVKSELMNERGRKENLSPQQEFNPWPPEHWPGALSTEQRELMESKVILSDFIYENKFTIFIHLSLLIITSTVLILAVCRTPVTHELS